MRILCINHGSSSVKYALIEIENQKERLIFTKEQKSHSLLKTFPLFDAVCHRVVHGGKKHAQPEKVTKKLLRSLALIQDYAPLHLPIQIQTMRKMLRSHPKIPQVACFDTAFHRKMPRRAQMFAIPRKYYQQGIQKYGFHGLSYEYIVSKIKPSKKQRTIICHLGNGASTAALLGKIPQDTSMGLTPTGGFMMGTRSGDLDPGLILYLAKTHPRKELEKLLDQESGLKGVSGVSSNMETLLKSPKKSSQEAIEMFCYQVQKEISSYAAALGGLDLLVFTGGIGEKSAYIRNQILKNLHFLSCKVRTIATNEDLMMARHAYQILS